MPTVGVKGLIAIEIQNYWNLQTTVKPVTSVCITEYKERKKQ